MEPKVKTIATNYIVKVNNTEVERKATLREARLLVKNMPVNDAINVVHIVKQTVTEKLLDTYESKTQKVLIASQLDDDLI